MNLFNWPYYSPLIEGELDEANWGRKYPLCNAKHQSPIDIQKKKVVYSSEMSLFDLEGYDGPLEGVFKLSNNGHSGKLPIKVQYDIQMYRFLLWSGNSGNSCKLAKAKIYLSKVKEEAEYTA